MDESIKKIVRETYQECVKNCQYSDDFKRSLKAHERIPVFFNNLVREFSGPGMKLKRETIVKATQDLTALFIKAIHLKGEERLMSPLRLAMAKAKQDQVREMQKLSDALEHEGEAHETVTQDKAGNETVRQEINLDKIS